MRKAGIILFLISLCMAGSAAGQEGVEFEEWMDYEATYGEAKAVGLGERTLTILDSTEEGDDKIIKYNILPKAEFEGVKGLEEIFPGDMVDIEYYTTADGKRMADFVSVEKRKEEEEREDLTE